jgi:hypothetical protein
MHADDTRAPMDSVVVQVLAEAGRLASARQAREVTREDLLAVLQSWIPAHEDRASRELLSLLPSRAEPPANEGAVVDATYRTEHQPQVDASVAAVVDTAIREFGAAHVGRRELVWALIACGGRASRSPAIQVWLLSALAIAFAVARGGLALLMFFPDRAVALMTERVRDEIFRILIVAFLTLGIDALVMSRLEKVRKLAWVAISRRRTGGMAISRATFTIAFIAFAIAMCKTSCFIIP